MRYLNEFDTKTLVGYVILQVGMKYEVTAVYPIALRQVVFLTSAVAVSWFERAIKMSFFHRDFA